MERVDAYTEMSGLRGRDKYPDASLKRYFIHDIFPKTVEEMALRLSNVTAGFYGIGLKQAGLQCGWERIDGVSKALFHELGQLKAVEAREIGIALPQDVRAIAMVFITAVFTSSPEYNFEFPAYSPAETIMKISGKCRYYRIARKLGIDRYLTWPTLTTFFEGIAAELKIECSVEMQVRKLEDDGTCDYLAIFARP